MDYLVSDHLLFPFFCTTATHFSLGPFREQPDEDSPVGPAQWVITLFVEVPLIPQAYADFPFLKKAKIGHNIGITQQQIAIRQSAYIDTTIRSTTTASEENIMMNTTVRNMAFTKREEEVLGYMAQNYTYDEIILLMKIRKKTLLKHIEHIGLKTGIRKQARIARYAIEHGYGNCELVS
jgi:DNA-binding CsgD family transcriptional regulator